MKHKSYLFFTNNEELKRGKALLSREDVRVFCKESGSSDAEGNHLSLEKYLETLDWSRRATFVRKK
jgi:hypothetical protein